MRVSLYVVFLALCIVTWECTANVEGSDGQQVQGGGGAVSPTAAPQQDSPGQLNQPDDRKDNDGDQTGRGQVDRGQNKEDDDDDDDDDDRDDHADANDGKAPKGDSQSGTKGGTPSGVDPSQVTVATTTTTIKNQDTVDVLTPQAGNDHSSLPNVHSTSGVPNTGERRNPKTHNADGSVRTEVADVKTTTTTTAQAPGVQKDVIPPPEVKTTTITAEGQIVSGSQKDKVKEQSTPPKNGDASDLKVTDAAEAATTTTTNAPVNTLPKQSKIPQSVNNKDSSSSSTSLLLAVTTLAVILVSPV